MFSPIDSVKNGNKRGQTQDQPAGPDWKAFNKAIFLEKFIGRELHNAKGDYQTRLGSIKLLNLTALAFLLIIDPQCPLKYLKQAPRNPTITINAHGIGTRVPIPFLMHEEK